MEAIAELHLDMQTERKTSIGTDESWMVRRSTITFSNLYDGEHRDDTLENVPVCHASLCEAPKGNLEERMSLPVTVHEVFSLWN